MSYTQKQLFDWITQALQDKPCRSLAELSRELQVSRRTIQNTVKKITGKRFKDLREKFLLAKVENLLIARPGVTIKELSSEAGYRSPRSFARAVRRACGISPEQLRIRFAKELLAYKN